MKANRLEQWHDRIFSSHWRAMLVACIVFAPLLYINVRNSSDWGDDFAQYIHQAKNIVEGIPQSQTGFIFNRDYPVGGPKAYPVGFPLLLAPAYALAGNNLYAFTFTVAFLTWLLAISMTLFFMRFFRALPAIILTAFFVYNPLVILFKQEVMSDLPFGFFLVLLTLLYTDKAVISYRKAIVIALLTGFLISVKSIGLFFPVAIIADLMRIAFVRWRKGENAPGLNLIPGIIMVIGGIGFYAFLNMVLFRLPSGGGIRDYLYIFHFGGMSDLVNIILRNLAIYMEATKYIFVLQVGNFIAAGLAISCIAMTMLYFGIIQKFVKGFGFLELMGLAYLAVLLVYPYNRGGCRFIYPIAFLLIYYMASGFKGFNPGIPLSGLAKTVITGCLLVVFYLPGLILKIQTQNDIVEGPQQEAPKEAFKWIKDNTPKDAVIAFVRARALSLYAERTGFANLPGQDIVPMHESFMKAGVNYFLESKSLSDESFRRYISMNRDKLDHVWGNSEFDLYRLHNR